MSMYASASASVSSSLVESVLSDSISDSYVEEDEEESMDEEEDEDDEEYLSNTNSSTSNASMSSLVEEDLEKKKRLLHKQAKRLLRKNKKLRRNYAITGENIVTKRGYTAAKNVLSSNSDQTVVWQVKNSVVINEVTVRKSQRQRKTTAKFNDTEYSLDESLDDSHLSTENQDASNRIKAPSGTESEKKGELKLRIKRITTGPALSVAPLNAFNETVSSNVNFTSALNSLSPVVVKACQNSIIKSAEASPGTRVTRRIAAKLNKNESPIFIPKSNNNSTFNNSDLYDVDNDVDDIDDDSKHDEDQEKEQNDEYEVILNRNHMPEAQSLPSSFKTLAQLKFQIATKKRASEECHIAMLKSKCAKIYL